MELKEFKTYELATSLTKDNYVALSKFSGNELRTDEVANKWNVIGKHNKLYDFASSLCTAKMESSGIRSILTGKVITCRELKEPWTINGIHKKIIKKMTIAEAIILTSRTMVSSSDIESCVTGKDFYRDFDDMSEEEIMGYWIADGIYEDEEPEGIYRDE